MERHLLCPDIPRKPVREEDSVEEAEVPVQEDDSVEEAEVPVQEEDSVVEAEAASEYSLIKEDIRTRVGCLLPRRALALRL